MQRQRKNEIEAEGHWKSCFPVIAAALNMIFRHYRIALSTILMVRTCIQWMHALVVVQVCPQKERKKKKTKVAIPWLNALMDLLALNVPFLSLPILEFFRLLKKDLVLPTFVSLKTKQKIKSKIPLSIGGDFRKLLPSKLDMSLVLQAWPRGIML